MKFFSTICRSMLIVMIVAALSATVQAEEVSLKILAPWEAAGKVFKVGPEKLQFIGTFGGHYVH